LIREQQKEQTRNTIIEVAYDLFISKGFHHTTMKDIYLASEIGKRTLYRYFSSKEDLATVIGNRIMDLYVRDIEDMAFPEEVQDSYQRIEYMIKHVFLPKLKENPQHARYIAQFDMNITGPYPDLPSSKETLDIFERLMKKVNSLIDDSGVDHSLRSDIDLDLAIETTFNAGIALAERIVVREERLRVEQKSVYKMLDDFFNMALHYMKNK
jgi:AcrR family transcriptional regulator